MNAAEIAFLIWLLIIGYFSLQGVMSLFGLYRWQTWDEYQSEKLKRIRRRAGK